MKSKQTVIVIFLLLNTCIVFAQKEVKEKNGKAYFGIGAGLDYGGLGIKGEFLPSKWMGIFAGVGFNFVEPAVNGGLTFRLLPDKKFTPTVLALYGYNAAIRIKSGMGFSDIHRKTYYGPSLGAGTEMYYGANKNKLSLALLVPFRNAAFRRDYDEYEHYLDQKILPVTFSFGVNFAIRNKSRSKN